MPQLLDQFGNPVDTRQLATEQALPSLTGVRTILANHPSRGLTPQRLASILLEAEEGDATRYLELAEDMEEKDLHYLSVLNTRKRAVSQLQITVESASDAAEHLKHADFVREFLRRDDLEEVLFDVLDAIGKGFSVTEIVWETAAKQWMPERLCWRDPRWFEFDRADGTTLRLREGASCVDLAPFKYIRHVHKAKSGLPIRSGLARAAGWSYLFKNFAMKDWVAFAEVFGQPYRVGKYQPGATPDDKAALLRAVANIGSDAAAIIPQSMLIEFVEASQKGSIDLYEKLCDFLDRQVSKAVLGQTLTSDVSKAGGSRALGDVHNDVRRDIMRSDSKQLAATLNRDLVRPMVDLNYGPQEAYPRLRIGLPDELSTTQKIDALKVLVPQGLRVEESAVRDLIGFADPAKDAVVLRPPTGGAAPADETAPQPAAQAARRRDCPIHGPAAHAAAGAAPDAIDELAQRALEEDGWEPLIEPVIAPVRTLLEEATSLEDLRTRLAEAVGQMDVEQLRELLARAGFNARLAGELGIPLSELGE